MRQRHVLVDGRPVVYAVEEAAQLLLRSGDWAVGSFLDANTAGSTGTYSLCKEQARNTPCSVRSLRWTRRPSSGALVLRCFLGIR
jgi:hypothetical protein